MALGTVTKVKATVFGDLRVTIVDVRPTSGANYVIGGAPFGAAQVPGATGTVLGVIQIGGGTSLVRVAWDASTGKLMVFKVATDVDSATNDDYSAAGQSVRLLVLSK